MLKPVRGLRFGLDDLGIDNLVVIEIRQRRRRMLIRRQRNCGRREAFLAPGKPADLVLQRIQVRADQPGCLDALEAQLSTELVDHLCPKSGDLVAQYANLFGQHSLDFVSKPDLEPQVSLASRGRLAGELQLAETA